MVQLIAAIMTGSVVNMDVTIIATGLQNGAGFSINLTDYNGRIA